MVHGCIDGYSRLPIYLVCCDNNLNSSVLKMFEENLSIYGLPKHEK